MIWIFWLSIALVIYTYLGYGLLLFVLIRIKRLFKKPSLPKSGFEPKVTLVIPAYNEENFIL